MLIAVGTRSANRLANVWYCWKVGFFFPKELFRRSVFAATATSGLRVFEFHDSWEESACRPKVRPRGEPRLRSSRGNDPSYHYPGSTLETEDASNRHTIDLPGARSVLRLLLRVPSWPSSGLLAAGAVMALCGAAGKISMAS
ncbi:hypothetical protein E4U30_000171 [Claviceps sp. LM220 group G6]|nr:hypothetical protein E4U30_000171 [Claviceps sp. LM220 group G6]